MPAFGDQGLVWELRVHGVGNTPPSSVLETAGEPDADVDEPPRMRRVAGGVVTGFFRREDGLAADNVVVEAYSWGRLTVGAKRGNLIADLRRAGWTLLLPFALVNAALWARPRIPYDPDERGITAVTGWLVRVVALGLTCTLVLAVSGVSMDVIAWQCRGDPCGGPRWISDLLHQPFFTDGARRTLAGAAVPVLLIVVFYWLAGSSSQYEAISSRHVDAVQGDDRTRTRLEHPHFWRGSVQVRALRLVHAGAGAAVAAHALAGCVWVSRKDPPWVSQVAIAASVVAFCAILIALVALHLPAIRVRGSSRATGVTSMALAAPLMLGAFALAMAAVAAWNVTSKPSASGTGPPFPTMPGLDGTIRVTYLFMFAVLLALMVLSAWQADRAGQLDRGADSAIWSGLAAPVFAGAAWVVAMIYSVTALFGTQQLMAGPPSSGQPEFAVMMQWSAVGLLAGVGITVLAAPVAVLRLLRVRRAETRELRRGVDRQNWHAYERAAQVGAARGLHRFMGYDALHEVGWLGIMQLTVVAGGAAVAVGRNIGFRTPQRHDLWGVLSFTVPDKPPDLPLTLGGLLATAILIALIALGFAAHRHPFVLRTLGIVWDIVTFWPRGAHPFAPPCYAEQAVPQLITRIEGLPDSPLILAGHSQGSVLCAATVAQLTPQRRGRTYLLTFGTQLTRLYGRAFPAFFALEGRLRLATLLGGTASSEPPWAAVRWRSLYRDTDFLGWPIAATRHRHDPVSTDESDDLARIVDLAVLDPPELDAGTGRGLTPTPGEIADPPIHAHSDYPLTPEYLNVRRAAAERLLQPPHSAAGHGSGTQPAYAGNGPSSDTKRLRTNPAPHHDRTGRGVIVLTGVCALILASLLPLLPASSTEEPATTPPVPSIGDPQPTISTTSPAAPTPPEQSIPPLARSADQPALAATVPLGGNLGGVAVAPDGMVAYIAHIDAKSIAILDTTRQVLTREIPLPERPRTVTFSPDGSNAYITLYGPQGDPVKGTAVGDSLVTVDTKTGFISPPINFGGNAYSAAVTPDGSRVFVADHDFAALTIIEAATGSVKKLDVAPNPHWVAFLNNGEKGYVADHESNVVQVIDPRRETAGTKISVGLSPHSLAVSPDQQQVYVTNYDADTVTVIDTVNDRVVGSPIRVGHRPQAVAFAPDGDHAYVANNQSDSVSVINTATRKVTSVLSVGVSPTAIAVAPHGRFAYISNLRSGTVSVLALA